MHTGFWWGNLREGDLFEDLGLDGRMILKWIFRKLNGRCGLDSAAQGRQVVGCCESNNEPLVSIKFGGGGVS